VSVVVPAQRPTSPTNRRGSQRGSLVGTFGSASPRTSVVISTVTDSRQQPGSETPTRNHGNNNKQVAPAQHERARVSVTGDRASRSQPNSSGSGPSVAAMKDSWSPAAVAAWIGELPPSFLPDNMRGELMAAVQAEGIDGNNFTKIVANTPSLASRGVPAPARAIKLRKAWDEVLREDACRKAAAAATSNPAKKGEKMTV